jgi:hypothetical protein
MPTALDAIFLGLDERGEGGLMSIGGAVAFDPPPGGRCAEDRRPATKLEKART